MNQFVVKILESSWVTHDVKRFIVERPQGYNFIPGQATDVAINTPDWKNELRPFTFTGLDDVPYLEFTIKIYSGRNGVTSMLGKTNAGSELILHDVFGAIHYKGPGVFIAGGAGITPFIAILRDLYQKHDILKNQLIFSNKTSKDVIYESEFEEMLGNNFIKVFTRENVIGFLNNRINRDFLIDTIQDFSKNFYLCGPDEFVNEINALLLELGARADTVIFEK